MEEETKVEAKTEVESPVVESDKPPAPAEVKTEPQTKPPKKSFLNSALFPFLGFILFGLAYMAVFFYLKPVAKDIVNTQILGIFKKFSMYVGWVFGLLSMIAMYFLYLIKKIVRLGKVGIINPVILFASVLPWYFFALQLLYHEKRYTDIGRGIITYVGQPLMWTFYVIAGMSALWFVFSIIGFLKKK